MTNYSITTDGRGAFVMKNGTETVGGPYFDNGTTALEKAKRRIRDLKRKDAPKASDHNYPLPERTNIVPQEAVKPAEREFINTGYMPLHTVPEMEDGPIMQAVREEMARDDEREIISAKLSTATNGGYGKFNTEPCEYDFGNDPGWINPPFDPYRGKPRNGYRPAHRANRFKR